MEVYIAIPEEAETKSIGANSVRYCRRRTSTYENLHTLAARPILWYLSHAKRHGIMISRFFRKERMTQEEWDAIVYPLPTINDYVRAINKIIARVLNYLNFDKDSIDHQGGDRLRQNENMETPTLTTTDPLDALAKLAGNDDDDGAKTPEGGITTPSDIMTPEAAEPPMTAEVSPPDIFEALKDKIQAYENQEDEDLAPAEAAAAGAAAVAAALDAGTGEVASDGTAGSSPPKVIKTNSKSEKKVSEEEIKEGGEKVAAKTDKANKEVDRKSRINENLIDQPSLDSEDNEVNKENIEERENAAKVIEDELLIHSEESPPGSNINPDIDSEDTFV